MPENKLKLLLIDGNNMCHRVYWAHKDLSHKGRHTGVLYGFFKQLVSLHKSYSEYFRVIAWDGGHVRRSEESQKGVETGIIPSAYKENRKERDSEEQEEIREQMRQVQDALKMVRCIQVRMDGIEGDDVINSYAEYVSKWGGEAVVVSSDKDFYQVLRPCVSIYDAMKSETWTEERFSKEFGFSPSLWVDAGGIMGDSGDNIHGAEGWGPVTTYKYIREHGGMEAVLAAVRSKEKRNKKEEVLVQSADRLRLARSLKQMDVVQSIPRPRVVEPRSKEALEKFFIGFGMVSLMQDSWRLV